MNVTLLCDGEQTYGCGFVGGHNMVRGLKMVGAQVPVTPAGCLRQAVLEPGRREALVRAALGCAVRELELAGAAVIRPGGGPYRVEYAGEREAEMRRWLGERVGDSLAAAVSELLRRPSPLPGAESAVEPLHPTSAAMAGLLVLWAAGAPAGGVESLRRALEVLIEVEHRERLYFLSASEPLGEEISRSLRAQDGQGLPAMLDLARTVSGADFTYWGSVHESVVDVEWHLGARDSGFGFELPLGEGVGGRAFVRGETLEVPDYLNCQYRYPGVSDATDREDVRSVLAIPVRGKDRDSGAVLYAVRRHVEPFSEAEQALLLRLKSSVEPVPGAWRAPRRLFTSDLDYVRLQKTELRRLLLNSDRVRDAEFWLERLLGGTAILVDERGHPYAPGNLSRFERLRLHSAEEPAVFPISGPGANGERGDLYLWSPVELPVEGWPDLLDDALVAVNVILDRAEQTHDRLNRRRSHWLRLVSEGRTGQAALRDGNRLGLPAASGEVWAFAWDPDRSPDGTRLRMLADDVVLDRLGGPLTVLEDGVGIVLLRNRPQEEPSSVRDELLRHVGPTPLWLVHGATYESLEGLKETLLQSVRAVKGLRSTNDERYIMEIHGRGLDSLLENPRISDELAAFADNLLAPLTSYDRRSGSELTRTFCLTLALGSPQQAAERLFVHANTARYRVRRAEQILGQSLERPRERAAMMLAAFVWLHHRDRTSPDET
jgi:hypothetical protein